MEKMIFAAQLMMKLLFQFLKHWMIKYLLNQGAALLRSTKIHNIWKLFLTRRCVSFFHFKKPLPLMQMSKSVIWQGKQASKQTSKQTKTEFNKQAFLRTSDISWFSSVFKEAETFILFIQSQAKVQKHTVCWDIMWCIEC